MVTGGTGVGVIGGTGTTGGCAGAGSAGAGCGRVGKARGSSISEAEISGSRGADWGGACRRTSSTAAVTWSAIATARPVTLQSFVDHVAVAVTLCLPCPDAPTEHAVSVAKWRNYNKNANRSHSRLHYQFRPCKPLRRCDVGVKSADRSTPSMARAARKHLDSPPRWCCGQAPVCSIRQTRGAGGDQERCVRSRTSGWMPFSHDGPPNTS